VRRIRERARSSSNIGREAARIGALSEPIVIWRTLENMAVERVICKGREEVLSEPGGGVGR
jgi:hypothetical protein